MNAIEIKGLRKQYGGFTLGGLDFTLPEGCIAAGKRSRWWGLRAAGKARCCG